MNNILEKQAAITNWRRENIVGFYRNRRYQYILPKEVDGIFSTYCVGFEIANGKVHFDKPIKGALSYLAENERDLPEIERRIDEFKRHSTNVPNFEIWVYSLGKDGFDHGKKVA